MTLTIKLDRNWSSFQLANSAPPLSVTDSAIAPSARMRSSSLNSNALLLRMRARRFASRTCQLQNGTRIASGSSEKFDLLSLGPGSPAQTEEVTLMRPIHGNL